MRHVSRVVVVAVSLWAVSAQAADTLVVAGAGGTTAPGLATSWTVEGDAVVFSLAAGADGAAWAQALSERLTGVSAKFADGKLTVSGATLEDLLERLSRVTLASDADPLAELAGLGGGVTMDSPEGGGSIRASKPTAVGPARALGTHNPGERFEAEVVSVTLGVFPQVTLKLKMRKGGRASALRKKLYYGKLIEATVVYAVAEGVIDLGNEANRRNLVAWYLKKGDRITIRPVPVSGGYEIDWLARR